MKKLLVLCLVFLNFGCETPAKNHKEKDLNSDIDKSDNSKFNFWDQFEPEARAIREAELAKRKKEETKYKIKREQRTVAEKKVILTALVDRCTDFGWESEDNIASCVKQEAYRDLKIQEQEYKIKLLEKRLIAANTPEERPLFLDILDFVIEEADKKENAQLRRDIMMLKAKSRSLKNRQNSQAALNALYKNNN